MMLPFVFLLLALSAFGADTTKDLAEDAEKYLLPGNISPIHYNLVVTTNIEKFVANVEKSFVFSGLIEITIEALDDNITEIIIHQNEIEILSASISALQQGSPDRTLTIGSYDDVTNKQSLPVSPALTKGEQYVLTLDYSGSNNNDLAGFYRSSYYVGLKRRWLLVTDFESFSARRAFPCFDEPVYKATFQLAVDFSQTLADDGYVAHFNTDVESEVVSNGRHITKFQKTPLPVSTYLVCFVIADFLSSPEPTYFNSSYNGENGTKAFRTVGRPSYFDPRRDLVSQVAGPAVLNFMTQKTGVGFGYNKVEQAGIPDFAAGAMENWGLTTYRENYVFWSEESGTTSQKEGVVTVTAHELGHQWFGDLVTLHWWTDLWLNEGFATYFEYHAADKIREPTLDTSSWDLIGEFVDYIVQYNAFYTDAFTDARPLTSEAYDQSSIGNFFDSISYDKGGSVLRMWMHVLSEDVFYDGLNRYLISQKENIGTPGILLASWDAAVNALPANQKPNFPASVPELFQDWHLQSGYPLITVKRQGADLVITQERFLLSSGSSTLRWNVPISYSTDLENNFNNTSPVAFALKSDDSTTVTIKNANASWVVLNNQATGYYRIDYDDDNWDALMDVLDDPDTIDQIHEYNRAQIIDDSSVLSLATAKDYGRYKIFLRLIGTLRHDRSLVVWKSGSRAMNYILTHLESNHAAYSLIKSYFSWVVKPAFEELTLKVGDSDSHTQKRLRVIVSSLACKLGVNKCQDDALELFHSRAFHPDMRKLVLCEGVRQEKAEWKNLVLETSQLDGPEKADFIWALSCTNDENQLNDLMDKPIEELNRMDKQDLIAAAAQQGSKQASFALKAFDQIKTSSKSSPILKKILRDISHKLADEEGAKSMEKLSENGAAMIRQNLAWKKTKVYEILGWLKKNLSATNTV